MRMIHYVRAGCLVTALGTCMLVAGLARGDVTTERPGSILIFPKVVNAGSRDTVIHIANTGNSIDNVHCFYLDGQLAPSGQQSLCTETDFDLTLTRQQPTHWVASQGRQVDPTDSPGSNGAGLDPGLIPPVGANFTGALVCVEVDDAGAPTAANKLKGEATLEGPLGDVAKYSAIAVQGSTVAPTCVISGKSCSSDADCTTPKDSCNVNVLQLDNTQYNACANAAQFNFIPDGATDPVIEAIGNGGTCTGGATPGGACSPLGTCAGGVHTGAACSATTASTDCGVGVTCTSTDCLGGTCTTGQSAVANTITVLPCNLDFQNQVATTFKLSYLVTDGDETQTSYSDSTERQCWASINLADIPPARFGGPTKHLLGPLATVLLTTAEGGPFFFVGETVRFDTGGNSARAAVNLHTEGTCHGATPDPVPCQSNADCRGVGTTNACDLTSPATIRLPSLP